MVTHKVAAMEELLPSYLKARSCYYRCLEELVGNRFFDLEIVSFLDKAQLTVSGRLKKKRY